MVNHSICTAVEVEDSDCCCCCLNLLKNFLEFEVPLVDELHAYMTAVAEAASRQYLEL